MKQKNLKQLSEKEFLARLEKSRKQSKDRKGKDADTAIKEIRKKLNRNYYQGKVDAFSFLLFKFRK